jgi:phage terminase large subunit
LRAVAWRNRVAVRSGHKIGKSTSAVILALWFVCCFPRARVIFTAPTHRQIKAVLWKELRRVYHRAKVPIGGILHEVPEAGLQFRDGREVIGLSTKEPEKMAGFSGPAILYVVDEASGVPEAIYEAIEGNRAGGADGGAKIVLFSNPTQTSGTFCAAFGEKRDFWFPIHVSSLEATKYSDAIPGLAQAGWVDERRAEWGELSPLYQVRVLGNFPSQSEKSVVGVALITAGVERWADTKAEGSLEFGVDVARFGDDETIIAQRRGLKVQKLTPLQSLDGVAIAKRVVDEVKLTRKPGEPPAKIKVDVIGYGASVVDQLRAYDQKGEPLFEVVDINVAEKATAEDFVNLRSQLAFAVTDWLKEGGAIPRDSKLEGDLAAPTYSFDGQGRRKVEPKDAIKARLGRSPDRGDAVALAIYSPPTSKVFVPTVKPAYRMSAGGARGF